MLTIGGWFMFGAIGLLILFVAVVLFRVANRPYQKALIPIVAVTIIALVFIIEFWYFNYTASGIRKMTDQKSNLQNGIERTVNVYTANGDLMASYTGKIDIEDSEGGYVKFDYKGKRYIYYNCFVETIAEIGQ